MGHDVSRVATWKTFLSVAVIGLAALSPYLVLRHRDALASVSKAEDAIASDEAPRALPERHASPGEGVLRAQMSADRLRIEALEERLSRSESRSTGSDESPAPTVEENIREHRQQMESALAAHRAEPVAMASSRRTTASLQATLEQAATGSKFRLVDVVCRTSTCLATVEWDNYDLAFQNYGAIVTHNYQLPCGVTMMVLAPQDRTTHTAPTPTSIASRLPTNHHSGGRAIPPERSANDE